MEVSGAVTMEPAQETAARLRHRLTSGETVFGCFLSLGSAVTAEIMGAAGFDFALIDLEHGSGGERDAFAQMQALAASNCAALVRVESTQRQRVHRVLDSGAHGIMFPRIDSAAEAEAAVASMRYPPAGVRGVASSNRACSYGANFRPYLEGSSNLLTIVQIESLAALEQADQIAAADGVDVLFVGPFDLSFAMGILGEFDNPRFVAAVKATGEAALRHGKHAGILLPAGQTVAQYHSAGYRFIVSASDAMLLGQSARSLVQSLHTQRSKFEHR
jgi:4-hydroxy-2-oxoheptanedioate aldolase